MGAFHVSAMPLKIREHPRIVIAGTSGSGKTTLARSLARELGREHIELDALHWGPRWTPRPEFPDLVRTAISADKWILDGNYGSVRDLVWPRATALVWLNYPFRVVLSRALIRTISRLVSREILFGGNTESFRGSFLHWDGIPWWVVRTYRRRRREIPALLSEARYAHLELIQFTSPMQARTWVESAGSLIDDHLITIRQYRDEDRSPVWDLHNQALQHVGAHAGNGPWDDDLRDVGASYIDRGGDFLVGLLRGEVIAMGALRRTGSIAGEIKRMRVAADYQRRGYGTQILQALEHRARELGMVQLVLDTTGQQVGAQLFYKKHGYHETGRSDSNRFTMIYYAKDLSVPGAHG